MRGEQEKQKVLFSYVAQEDRIPADHPLRLLRSLVDPILESFLSSMSYRAIDVILMRTADDLHRIVAPESQ
jgi:hypothetical protein